MSVEGGVEPEPAGDPILFFSSERNATNLEIWRSDLDMRNAAPLTDDRELHSWWPRASPSEDLVYFYRSPNASDKDSNNYEEASLWRMRRDGSELAEVRAAGTDGWTAQGVIDFSPDGSRVVMAGAVPDDSGSRWQLFTADADLANLMQITARGPLYADPSWSPDGGRIVYVAIPEDQTLALADLLDPAELFSHLEVFTANPDGTDEVRLTFDAIRDHDPYWSPDGSEIVFESAVSPSEPLGLGRWALRVVPALGGSVRTLVDDGNINTLARWTRDGAELYFHRLVFEPLQGWHLAKIRRDGSGLTRLSPPDAEHDQEAELFYP